MSLNMLVRWLKPRETVFFDLLEGSAANLVAMSQHFSTGLRSGAEGIPILRKEIKAFEHAGDGFTHRLLEHLDQTFITPIEREDILALAHAMDDVADCIDAVAERLVLYKIEEILPLAQDMADLLAQGTQGLLPLITALRSMKDPAGIRKGIHVLISLENQSDTLYHAALAQLFENPTDPVYLMKWKEIFGVMEDAMDRIELVAKVVGSTVMRNA
ncbi:MAG: putative pit accessory protein [Acidobacteria bacterium ADurb.Bin340]|mgnify:CR=1 FL=1|nr:MAG: putative pit accessory protein [Acidobacteria bacterium ADurb.Bin340]HOD32636.1 DUF47 family protein [Holophaga sp.]HQL48699.1 DUF47 family protein [Holophaga sp.]